MNVIGGMLLVGGFIPLTGTLFQLVASTDKVKIIKQPKNGLSLLLLLLGIFLQWPKPEDGWNGAFGTPLLEGAIIYFIQTLLFIK